jgi:hypothetical protein
MFYTAFVMQKSLETRTVNVYIVEMDKKIPTTHEELNTLKCSRYQLTTEKMEDIDQGAQFITRKNSDQFQVIKFIGGGKPHAELLIEWDVRAKLVPIPEDN